MNCKPLLGSQVTCIMHDAAAIRKYSTNFCGTYLISIPLLSSTSETAMSKFLSFVASRSSKSAFPSSRFSTIPSAGYLPAAEVRDRIFNVVKTIPSAPENLSEFDHFVANFGFDSLIRKNLNEKLMTEFCVSNTKAPQNFLSVPEAIKYFSTHPKAR